ncbi:MAG: substrate-binding domain-containing protein [Anaerolineae bacterium]
MLGKRNISRRSLLIGSAALGAGTWLSGCVPSTPQVVEKVVTQIVEVEKPTIAPEQKIKLVVEWPQYTPAKTRWGEKAFWSYMQAFPHIEIEPMYNTNPDEKLTVAIAGGTPPDVAWHGFGWARWAVEGVFMPLDELIAQNNVDKSIFWEIALYCLTWGGKLHSLPIGITGPTVVAVNEKIYGEAGVTPAYDGEWTYQDLITMGPAMTKPEQKQYAATLSEAYWLFWLVGMGGNMGSKNDQWLEMELNSPKRVATLQMYYDLINKYKIAVPPEVVSELRTLPHFASGLVGNMWGYTWMVPTFRNDVKDAFPWDIINVPYMEADGEKWRYAVVWPEEFAIISSTKHLQESWDFIYWFCTTQLDEAAMDANVVPGVKAVAQSEKYLRRDVPPKHIENYLKAFDHGVPLMNHPEAKKMIEKFGQLWPAVLTGEEEMSVQEVCDVCNAEAQKILDEWNAKHQS